MMLIPEAIDFSITSHFKANEFRCPCCGRLILDEGLVYQLEKLRDKIGYLIHIISGYRCIKHNKEAKGSDKSFHLMGRAADIVVDELSPEYLAKQADEFFRGVGIYNGHVHVDVGERYARWEN